MTHWDVTKKALCVFGIAEAMRYLHERHVMHRDLKTENVLLNEKFEPIIGDFGLSKVVTHFVTSTLDKGTPLYMAPEIAKATDGTEYGFPVDVYSYGVLVRMIYAGAADVDKIEKGGTKLGKLNPTTFIDEVIDGARFERPRMLKSDFLWKLICDCWQENPHVRPTFEQIVQRLKDSNMAYCGDKVDLEAVREYQSRLLNTVPPPSSAPATSTRGGLVRGRSTPRKPYVWD
jgi:serine/threonine protein kinase